MSNTFTGLVRLSKDPELRYLPSGQAVLTFNAASSVGFGDRQSTLWLRVSYWRNPEKLQPFLHKGDQCVVSGELSQSEYRAQDGSTKTSLELNANIIDLVGRRNESGQAPQQNYQPSGAQGQPSAKQAPSHDNLYAPYDDVPF